MLAEELRAIVKKISRENAEDKDIVALARLGHAVEALETTANSAEKVSFYAGYVAGWNDQREKKPLDTLGAWVRYSTALSVNSEPKTVTLVDLDTQQTLQNVTVAKKIVNVPPISHTAFSQLVERVAMLERTIHHLCLEAAE